MDTGKCGQLVEKNPKLNHMLALIGCYDDCIKLHWQLHNSTSYLSNLSVPNNPFPLSFFNPIDRIRLFFIAKPQALPQVLPQALYFLLNIFSGVR